MDINQGSKEGNREVFEWLKAHADYDQLINEYDYSWVHVSYRSPKRNRHQVLDITHKRRK